MFTRKVALAMVSIASLALLSFLGLMAAWQSGNKPRIVLAAAGFIGFAVLMGALLWPRRPRDRAPVP